MEIRVSLSSMKQYASIINKVAAVLTECGLETEQIPEDLFTVDGAKCAELSTSYCTATVTATGDYLIVINEEFISDMLALVSAPIDSIANVLPFILPAVKTFGKKASAEMEAKVEAFSAKWDSAEEPETEPESAEEPEDEEENGTTFEDLEALEKDEGDDV